MKARAGPLAALAWAGAVLGACAPVTPARDAAVPAPVRTPVVERLVVDKSARTLTVHAGGREVRRYTGLQLGDAPKGPKRFEGDERTPEGHYTIDARNPRSAYHLSLRISYPNARDRARAAALGRDPGGDIFLHGQPNGLPPGERVAGDWTDGCIALSDSQIEELWRLVPEGTAIDILP